MTFLNKKQQFYINKYVFNRIAPNFQVKNFKWFSWFCWSVPELFCHNIFNIYIYICEFWILNVFGHIVWHVNMKCVKYGIMFNPKFMKMGVFKETLSTKCPSSAQLLIEHAIYKYSHCACMQFPWRQGFMHMIYSALFILYIIALNMQCCRNAQLNQNDAIWSSVIDRGTHYIGKLLITISLKKMYSE